jgi:hypothetical protein
MKASEILTAVLLSPLAIFGGLPGVIAFVVGVSAHTVVSVAQERERDEVALREEARRLREAEVRHATRRG